jgi:hypothetical protein
MIMIINIDIVTVIAGMDINIVIGTTVTIIYYCCYYYCCCNFVVITIM